MQLVDWTEKQTTEVFSRIKSRLRDLAEASASILALKRLIKRN